jgi:hypothetical protein
LIVPHIGNSGQAQHRTSLRCHGRTSGGQVACKIVGEKEQLKQELAELLEENAKTSIASNLYTGTTS